MERKPKTAEEAFNDFVEAVTLLVTIWGQEWQRIGQEIVDIFAKIGDNSKTPDTHANSTGHSGSRENE